MRQILKYVLLLILFNVLVTVTVIFLSSMCGLNLILKDILILSLSFSVISALTLAIFLRGYTRTPDSQTMHTLVSISLKFLLDITLVLVWFYISKKTSLTSVFLFFVLYLTLSLFTIFVILKNLRNRSL
jgi:hypothetical protein